MTGNRSFYVVYTNHNNGFETDELDFGPNEEVSQQTVAEKLKAIHRGWYDRLDLNMVIAWSEIIEKPVETV